MNKRPAHNSIKLWAVAFWLLVWQAGSMILDRTMQVNLLLPSPVTALLRLGELALTSAFWRSVGQSFLRIIGGFLLSCLMASLLAVPASRWNRVRELMGPLVATIKAVPVASFIILALVWLGRETVPTFIALLMVLPVVWGNVSTGIRGTDTSLLALCRAYRVPRMRILRRVYVPSVAPHFTAAVQTGLGLAWKAGVAAEVLTAAKTSIGKEIFEAKQYMETVNLFAWTLVVILMSLIIEKLVMVLLSRLSRRQKEALT